jgi:hypothetical protein
MAVMKADLQFMHSSTNDIVSFAISMEMVKNLPLGLYWLGDAAFPV